jgi:hypothetical protein
MAKRNSSTAALMASIVARKRTKKTAELNLKSLI